MSVQELTAKVRSALPIEVFFCIEVTAEDSRIIVGEESIKISSEVSFVSGVGDATVVLGILGKLREMRVALMKLSGGLFFNICSGELERQALEYSFNWSLEFGGDKKIIKFMFLKHFGDFAVGVLISGYIFISSPEITVLTSDFRVAWIVLSCFRFSFCRIIMGGMRGATGVVSFKSSSGFKF
ncbi:hypothetical protein CEXT_764711 [Caerostris extrusa]|uniref:Uncharacterized protein n=1 Tax=Caerostris extrusa TaxID=172846 RepID=A0AAV4VKC6_CAEEX|nr:hypothetical protein CEXT_764711 [Caerostris extrusa]